MNGSILSGANLSYVDEMYRQWSQDRSSVDPEWDQLFRDEESTQRLKASTPAAAAGPAAGAPSGMVYKQSRVDSLIWGYRDVGYLYARLNPLAPSGHGEINFYAEPAHTYEQLTLSEFGLSEEDLETEFSAGRSFTPSQAPLSEIIRALRETYCTSVAVEFLHIQNKPIRRWLIQQMESTRNRPAFDTAKKRIILEDLIMAEEFERFMHTAFIGQKRFSLEGAEVVVPALHHVVDAAHGAGILEIVMGMTHRGRLTVLNRIMNKPLAEVFNEFESHEDEGDYGGSGDVKYHLGYVMDHAHEDGTSVRVDLVANPSHLESVGPVVEGMARAVEKERGDTERTQVLPILLHGDAAFSGQGVVAETFNLSRLRGYKTGGTIHVIINNQIGFTTSSRDARSTYFPTDVAKMLPVPIFHVNGEDPEAVVYTMDLATRFRQKFGRDAVVDIFCYRKYGHNEGDDPSFTHPLMYRIVEKKRSQATMYAETCRAAGVITAAEEDKLRADFRAELKAALAEARSGSIAHSPSAGTSAPPPPARAVRAPAEDTLRSVAARLSAVPEGFHIHPKLKRIVDEKNTRLSRDGMVDWALGESLAFGTLLLEKVPIRLSGQDSARGTFSQRHLVWWDTDTPVPQAYTPLDHLAPDQGSFTVCDSPLSEYSVLGFEYGYTLGRPRCLTMWEAQFGDFSNGGQVIVDNYVVSGEAKWGTRSGMVMLLPHGFEGQGPEHSSAHFERFLALCARDNIRVANCTTPAQYFHLLRRQALGGDPKPLVVMTPKSLLRHPRAVSPLRDLASGSFLPVVDDPARPQNPERLILCTGKVYYDLAAMREKVEGSGAAIVRVEQLYPFPRDEISALVKSYAGVKRVLWVQEEPRNRGAWTFMREHFSRAVDDVELKYVGRPESASVATGSHSRHEREQQEVAACALGVKPGEGEAAPRAAAPKAAATAAAPAQKATPARGASKARK
jgi:2-oxoglutarate dehydrogenase E1 component